MATEFGKQFTSSRRDLTDSGATDSRGIDAVTASAKGVVEDASGLFSALIATPGELRRVDLWTDGDSLVIHGYAKSPDVDATGTLHHGRAAAAMALAQLLTPANTTSADGVVEEPGIELNFKSLGDVIRFATEGDSGYRMCALNPDPDDPEAQVTVVLYSDSLIWGTAKGSHPIEFSPQRVGALWSRVLDLLGVADQASVDAG